MSGLLRNQYASCQIDLRQMTRASVCRTVMSGSVKTGNTRSEQMTSALPPKADSSRTSRQVRFVPILLQKSVEGFREQ